MAGCWQMVFACCLLVQRLSAEVPVKDDSTSTVKPDEELEERIPQRIASLQEMSQDEKSNFTDLALQSYNQQGEFLFLPFENTITVTFEKVIGSIMHLPMMIEKTNCTKKDLKKQDKSLTHPDSEEEPLKYCGSLPDREKQVLNCRFDFLKDEKTYKEAVIGHDCERTSIIDRRIFEH